MKEYYEIKATIRELQPPTWRRLRTPANITYNDLASIIEIAIEWYGYHSKSTIDLLLSMTLLKSFIITFNKIR